MMWIARFCVTFPVLLDVEMFHQINPRKIQRFGQLGCALEDIVHLHLFDLDRTHGVTHPQAGVLVPELLYVRLQSSVDRMHLSEIIIYIISDVN